MPCRRHSKNRKGHVKRYSIALTLLIISCPSWKVDSIFLFEVLNRFWLQSNLLANELSGKAFLKYFWLCLKQFSGSNIGVDPSQNNKTFCNKFHFWFIKGWSCVVLWSLFLIHLSWQSQLGISLTAKPIDKKKTIKSKLI